VVSEVSDEHSWRKVKDLLLKSIGMGSVPVIEIVDADYGHNRVLYLTHEHDGRDLHMEYASKTLAHLHKLWRRTVLLETVIHDKPMWLSYTDRGFAVKESR
jgi:stage V sporulation protein R